MSPSGEYQINFSLEAARKPPTSPACARPGCRRSDRHPRGIGIARTRHIRRSCALSSLTSSAAHSRASSIFPASRKARAFARAWLSERRSAADSFPARAPGAPRAADGMVRIVVVQRFQPDLCGRQISTVNASTATSYSGQPAGRTGGYKEEGFPGDADHSLPGAWLASGLRRDPKTSWPRPIRYKGQRSLTRSHLRTNHSDANRRRVWCSKNLGQGHIGRDYRHRGRN